jgi:hypothetical protein
MLLLVGLLLATTGLATLGLLQSLASDLGRCNLAGDLRRHADALELAEILGETHHVVWQRLEHKLQVTDDVIMGRVSLTQAAALFRSLDQSHRCHILECCPQYPGSTMEERYCRQVIAWVRQGSGLPTRPDRAGLAQRLERELDHRLACPQKLLLPEVHPHWEED